MKPLNTFIHQIKKSDSQGDTASLGDPVEIGYTKSDNPHKEPPIVDAQDECCYAKIVRTERNFDIHHRFFVKVTMDNRLIDPWNEMEMNRNLRLASSMGRDPYHFVEISKQGYDLYMLFLLGRSLAHYDKASREVKHA